MNIKLKEKNIQRYTDKVRNEQIAIYQKKMSSSGNEKDTLLGANKSKTKRKNKQVGNNKKFVDDDNNDVILKIDKYILSTLVLTIAFFFLFAPFSAIQNLESSLNAEDKLGPTALATLYLVYTFGCLLAPAVVGTLGAKYSMVISSVFVCLFVVAHVKPTWFTLMPASASVGLWCAFMWAAQGVYITNCALGYAASNEGVTTADALNLFNGMFWGLYNVNQILGNVISSLVLSRGHSQQTLFTLFFLFLALAVLATCLMCMLRPLAEINDSIVGRKIEEKDVAEKTVGGMIVNTFAVMQDREMMLLSPLFFFTGLSFGFLCSDFSKDLVHESLGVQHIGLVMCAFGGADAIACLILGKASKYIDQRRLMIFMYFGYTCLFLFFMVWSVRTNAYIELYLVAIIYGCVDAIAITQIYAVIGERFQDNMESAFALFRMWNSLAMSLAFFGSSLLPWFAKVLVILIALNISMAGFFALKRDDVAPLFCKSYLFCFKFEGERKK